MRMGKHIGIPKTRGQILPVLISRITVLVRANIPTVKKK
ncbi:hypothetical protein T190820D02B_20236 [Tenacibaculum sp. 190524A05c]